jgi:hypothetical protein
MEYATSAWRWNEAYYEQYTSNNFQDMRAEAIQYLNDLADDLEKPTTTYFPDFFEVDANREAARLLESGWTPTPRLLPRTSTRTTEDHCAAAEETRQASAIQQKTEHAPPQVQTLPGTPHEAIPKWGKPLDRDTARANAVGNSRGEPAVAHRAPGVATPQDDAFQTVPGSAPSGLLEALRNSKREVRFGQPTTWNVMDPHAEEILARTPVDLGKIDAVLAANGITELKPLDAGFESIVLDAGDKVVRLTTGQRRQTPDIPEYNKPIAQGEIAGVRIEILPKLDVANITTVDVKAIEVRLAARDLHWGDAAPDNLGRDTDGNLKIIDGRISSTRPGQEPPAAAKIPSLTEAAMRSQPAPGAQALQAERQDFDGAVARLSAETGLRYTPAANGEFVSGMYRENLTLNSGRFAVIDNGMGFALVPWTEDLDQRLGRHVSGVATKSGGIEWTFGRKRGLGI